MSKYIEITYYDTDKKDHVTIKCDAASLCQSEPSHKGRKAQDKHIVQTKTTVFKLSDLPNALRAHGKKHTGHAWEKAAKMQEKWFSSPAKVMPQKIKKAIDIDWPKDLVLTDYYTLEWLEKANVTGVVTKGIERLLKGRRNHGPSAEITGRLWDREAPSCIYNRAAKYGRKEKEDEGLYAISPRSGDPYKKQAYQVLRQSYGDTKNFLLKNKDMQKFHKYFSFQSYSLFDTWDKAVLAWGDRILKDEFFGTVAGCSLVAAIGKYRMPSDKLIVESVYLYVRDTFDFNNDKDKSGKETEDQYLGHWNHTGFDVFYLHQALDKVNVIEDITPKPKPVFSPFIAMPPTQFKSAKEHRYFPVRNSHFNQWRNLNKRGGDLLIFSSLKEFRCDPPIEVKLK